MAAHRGGPRPGRRADGAAPRAGRLRRLDLASAGRHQLAAGRVRLRPVLMEEPGAAQRSHARGGPVNGGLGAGGEPFNAAEWLVARHARATPDRRAITAVDLDGSV